MGLLFARHGESEANVRRTIDNRGDGPGLTEAGRAQVARLADALRDRSIARVYASPLRRATESARVLGATLGADVAIVDALREFDCGIYEGRADADAWAAHAAIEAAWLDPARADDRLEGGESLTDLHARFRSFVTDRIVEAATAGMICVGHGGLYRWVLPPLVADVDGRPIEPPTLHYGEALETVVVDGRLRFVGRQPAD